MQSLVNPAGETTGWSYLDNSWLSTQTLENGSAATVATTTYSYNALGEMTELLNQDGESTPATLSQFGGTDSGAMVYDAAGNRTSMPVSVPGAPSGYSGTNTYSYADNSGHTAPSWLTGESSTRLSSYSQSSAYDAAGNPTSCAGTTNSFNADNQNVADTFDGNGNPTTYRSSTCAYDEENRAVSLDTALTATYDGDGLRAWKNNGTTTTYFLYDGIEPVCELDASGGVTATNTFGAHGLVSRNVSAGSTFYTFDPQGGAAQRLTSSDTVADTDAYNAWGSRTSTGGGDVFTYGAQWGYYTDAETGLILCGHRYYDPARGRWLTRDPIGYAGGVGLYAYCGDGPVGRHDRSGYVLENGPGNGSDYGNGQNWWVVICCMLSLCGGQCNINNDADPGGTADNGAGTQIELKVPEPPADGIIPGSGPDPSKCELDPSPGAVGVATGLTGAVIIIIVVVVLSPVGV